MEDVFRWRPSEILAGFGLRAPGSGLWALGSVHCQVSGGSVWCVVGSAGSMVTYDMTLSLWQGTLPLPQSPAPCVLSTRLWASLNCLCAFHLHNCHSALLLSYAFRFHTRIASSSYHIVVHVAMPCLCHNCSPGRPNLPPAPLALPPFFSFGCETFILSFCLSAFLPA